MSGKTAASKKSKPHTQVSQKESEIMTIIYATGQPRFFEFGTANNHEQLPPGAIVLAVAERDRIAEHLDEDVFARMTDEEYYELQGMINDTRHSPHASH
jgi:hypothetical protein